MVEADMKTGDKVTIKYEEQTVLGTVKLASPNSKSLMLEFEEILFGFAGMMPVMLHEDGIYRDLFLGNVVELETRN
jgi:hypothetical protein